MYEKSDFNDEGLKDNEIEMREQRGLFNFQKD